MPDILIKYALITRRNTCNGFNNLQSPRACQAFFTKFTNNANTAKTLPRYGRSARHSGIATIAPPAYLKNSILYIGESVNNFKNHYT